MSEENQVDVQENNLCIPVDAFEQFQADSMYEEEQFITLSDIEPPAPPEPVLVDASSFLPYDNEVVLSSLENAEVTSSQDTSQENTTFDLSRPEFPQEHYSVDPLHEPPVLVEPVEAVEYDQSLQYVQAQQYESPPQKLPKKKGRQRKSAYSKIVDKTDILDPVPTDTPKTKRGRKRKDQSLNNSLPSAAVSKPKRVNGRHDEPTVEQDFAESQLNNEIIINSNSENKTNESMDTSLITSNLDTPKPGRGRGRKKKLPSIEPPEVSQTIAPIDNMSTPDTNNVDPQIVEEPKQPKRRGRSKKTVQPKVESDPTLDYSQIIGEEDDLALSSFANTTPKKRGRPRKVKTEFDPHTSTSELTNSDNIEMDDGDDICLSRIKETMQTNINNDSTELNNDRLTPNKMEKKSKVVESGGLDINGTPSKNIPELEAYSLADTVGDISMNDAENAELTLAPSVPETNELLVEDTSKRRARRKVKKPLHYEEDSDEDPFANVELSDEEPRKKKGKRYYSDDEYVPGKKGKVSESEPSDSDIDEVIDEYSKPKKKRTRNGSQNKSPRKPGSSKIVSDINVTTIAPNPDSLDDDDIEVCLQSSVIHTSEASTIASKWGPTDEFQNYFAKKISGTDLQIKKVNASEPSQSTTLDIPVLKLQEPKKYTEISTQTAEVVIKKSTVGVQTGSPNDVPMKDNVPLTPAQSEKACEFLKSVVTTTVELGQLMTSKSEDFIKKKINTSNVTDTFKMDYCVKKSFLLFKLAKHNLQQMEEDLGKQYEEFLKDQNLLSCREQPKKVEAKPRPEADDDSDCEIVGELKAPTKKEKPKLSAAKTVFLNKELSIKIAKKAPVQEPNTKKPNQKLNIKDTHAVWLSNSVMVKKVKTNQSFLAQDSRNKKPPDCYVTEEMVSDFFISYWQKQAQSICAPYTSSEWLDLKSEYVCCYFSVATEEILDTDASVSNSGNLCLNTDSNVVSDLKYQNNRCHVNNPGSLISLCMQALQNQNLIDRGCSYVVPEMSDEQHDNIDTLFRLCMKAITIQLKSQNVPLACKDQSRCTFNDIIPLTMHQEEVKEIEVEQSYGSKQDNCIDTLFRLCLKTITIKLKMTETIAISTSNMTIPESPPEIVKDVEDMNSESPESFDKLSDNETTNNDYSINSDDETTWATCNVSEENMKIEDCIEVSHADIEVKTPDTLFSLCLNTLQIQQKYIKEKAMSSSNSHTEMADSCSKQEASPVVIQNQVLSKHNTEEVLAKVLTLKSLSYQVLLQQIFPELNIHTPKMDVNFTKNIEIEDRAVSDDEFSLGSFDFDLDFDDSPAPTEQASLKIIAVKSLVSLCLDTLQYKADHITEHQTNILTKTTTNPLHSPKSLLKIALDIIKMKLYKSSCLDLYDVEDSHFGTTTKGNNTNEKVRDTLRIVKPELTINSVNTLSEEAFHSMMGTQDNSLDEETNFYNDDDSHDFDTGEAEYESESRDESHNWVSQVKLNVLPLDKLTGGTMVPETLPNIVQIKSEPLDEVPEIVDPSIVKTEPEHHVDGMTMIPDNIVTKKEQGADQIGTFDVNSFESFVRQNKMMHPLDADNDTFSQAVYRVRRQHEPDYANEGMNYDDHNLLIPQAYEPHNIETVKDRLMESSSDESSSSFKKNDKKKTDKKRGRPRKDAKNTPKEVPPPKEKPPPAPVNEVARLTKRMRDKIRQEEKKVESSDSEQELPLSARKDKSSGKDKHPQPQVPEGRLTRRMREKIGQEENPDPTNSDEKAEVHMSKKDKNKKPTSKSKAEEAEIQCNNVDSTEQIEKLDRSKEDDPSFSGFTAVDQNEISSYQKYVKFVYDKILPKVSAEAESSQAPPSALPAVEDDDPPLIDYEDPVEMIECQPTIPAFNEEDVAGPVKKRKARPKTFKEVKNKADDDKPEKVENNDKKEEKNTEVVTPQVQSLEFVERDGWHCHKVNIHDEKLQQIPALILDKLPESFVDTYNRYQCITLERQEDEEVERLINLQTLNRSVVAKDSIPKKVKPKTKQSVENSEESRTTPVSDGDHYAELTPSEDECDDDNEIMPTVQNPTQSVENNLAKNSLMDDKESDSEMSLLKIKEEIDPQAHGRKKKAKGKEVMPEHPDSLMLTADKMMNKELNLLHAPVVLDEQQLDVTAPVAKKHKSRSKRQAPRDRAYGDDDSSGEEEKQWVSTKEKLLKRLSKKDNASLDDAKRAKLVSEFIERRGVGQPDRGFGPTDKRVMVRQATRRRLSGKKRLEREKQMKVLSQELFGHTANDGILPGKKVSQSYFKGRRNIRKVIDKKSLARSTVVANMEEFERKRRLNQRHAKLSELLGCEEGVSVLVINDEVCLEYDFEEQQPIVTIHSFFTKVMKAHQYEGVKFMWDACFESLEKIESGHPGGGCILAHCMGLGKTLQVLALLHTVLTHPRVGMQRVLVCCPLSTVLNWVDEIHKWIGPVTNKLKVFELSKLKKTYERAYQLEDWYNGGGIFIIGYELFRSLTTLDPDLDDVRPTIINKIRTALLDPGPDIVVCDEGHLLKNDSSVLAVAMSRVVTKRRIVLTGTPMQNNLREYYCMVNFIKPNLLGTYSEFSNRFENPIMNGQHRDSHEEDTMLMKQRTHILHKVLEACLQRQEASVLYPYLPKKHEYTLFITLTRVQWDLYKHYMRFYANQNKQNILKDFHSLQKIWSHPLVLHTFQNRSRDARLKLKAEKLEDDLAREELASEDIKSRAPEVWWTQYLDEHSESGTGLQDLESSNKFGVVFSILEECNKLGDKVLIFSTSLTTMDTLEFFLKKINKWSLGQEYYRLDGTVPAEVRQKWCREFNAEGNHKTKLFLISTRAGCLGLNLVAANRVIILDTSWNPAHDIQSIFRVYRFGQKKDCHIYRLVALGTMEQKIYERSVTKQAVACRVVDEQQIDRHYNMAELTELYRYDESGLSVPAGVAPGVTDVCALRVSLVSGAVHALHEHDSLLRGSAERPLDEHERAAAWMQFEQEQATKQMQNELVSEKLPIKLIKKKKIETIVSTPTPPPEVKQEAEGKPKRGKKNEPKTEEPTDDVSNSIVEKITDLLLQHGFDSDKHPKQIQELVASVQSIIADKPGDEASDDSLSQSIAKVFLKKCAEGKFKKNSTDTSPGVTTRGRYKKQGPEEPMPSTSKDIPPPPSYEKTIPKSKSSNELKVPEPTTNLIFTAEVSNKIINALVQHGFSSDHSGSILKSIIDIVNSGNLERLNINNDRVISRRIISIILENEKTYTAVDHDNVNVTILGSHTPLQPPAKANGIGRPRKGVNKPLQPPAAAPLPSQETPQTDDRGRRKAAIQAERQIDTNSIIDLDDDDNIVELNDSPKSRKKNKDCDFVPTRYEQQLIESKEPRKYKKKERKQIHNVKTEEPEKTVPNSASNSILLSDDDDVVLSTASTAPQANETPEQYPLHPSLLQNNNFVKIVAHTYLDGNSMLDEDAAMLAAKYSTQKALKEYEETKMGIMSGPIYDIAVKVLGMDILKKLNQSKPKVKSEPSTTPIKLEPATNLTEIPMAAKPTPKIGPKSKVKSGPKKAVEVPKKAVEVPKKAIEVPKKSVEVPKKAIEVPKKSVEVPKKAIEVPKKSVEVPKKSVEVPKKSVEVPKVTTVDLDEVQEVSVPPRSTATKRGTNMGINNPPVAPSSNVMPVMVGGTQYIIMPSRSQVQRPVLMPTGGAVHPVGLIQNMGNLNTQLSNRNRFAEPEESILPDDDDVIVDSQPYPTTAPPIQQVPQIKPIVLTAPSRTTSNPVLELHNGKILMKTPGNTPPTQIVNDTICLDSDGEETIVPTVPAKKKMVAVKSTAKPTTPMANPKILNSTLAKNSNIGHVIPTAKVKKLTKVGTSQILHSFKVADTDATDRPVPLLQAPVPTTPTQPTPPANGFFASIGSVKTSQQHPNQSETVKTKTVCKPGDILRITETGQVEILNKNESEQLNVAKKPEAKKTYAKSPAVTPVKNTEVVRSRTRKDSSSSSSSEDSRPPSPHDPLSCLKDVVHIRAAEDIVEVPCPSWSSSSYKSKPSTSRSSTVNSSVSSKPATSTRIQSKSSTQITPSQATSKIVKPQKTRAADKVKELIKQSNDVIEKLNTLLGPTKVKKQVPPSKPEPTKPAPSVPATSMKKVNMPASSSKVVGTSKNIILAVPPASAGGKPAKPKIQVTSVETINPGTFKPANESVKRSATQDISAVKKKKIAPMTLKDFDIDDIDDIIELD